MTQQQDHVFPDYRPPEVIRSEEFSRRADGFDRSEVREYLERLADQVQSGEAERSEVHNENQRLRREVEHLRARAEPDGEINPQAVKLFSQAQQVADQLVEEAVLQARDLMASARLHQREILEEAQKAAEAAAAEADAAGGTLGDGTYDESTSAAGAPAYPAADIEYVRTFARVAQVQLKSVLDALTEQVEKLGEVPQIDERGRRDR